MQENVLFSVILTSVSVKKVVVLVGILVVVVVLLAVVEEENWWLKNCCHFRRGQNEKCVIWDNIIKVGAPDNKYPPSKCTLFKSTNRSILNF